MSDYHGKYYNPSHEDDYGAFMSGECDSGQIERCRILTGVECKEQNINNCPISKGEIKIKRTGCPHCGSPTKHKSWCPDQQIINAFKDLKSIESDSSRSQEVKP